MEQLTEAEDLRAYVKSTNAYNTIADLEGAHVVQRRQMKFPTPTGETPIDFDELKHSANRLESLQYNIPLYVQGAADHPEDIPAMQDVSTALTLHNKTPNAVTAGSIAFSETVGQSCSLYAN